MGEVNDGLVVVTGGNGYAAKSADEIGRLTALLSTSGGCGSGSENVEEDLFMPQFLPA